jgi:hypothetical protein
LGSLHHRLTIFLLLKLLHGPTPHTYPMRSELLQSPRRISHGCPLYQTSSW